MNREKIPLGVRIAESIAESGYRDNIKNEINESEGNDLMEIKQLLLKINRVLENNIFLQALEKDEEVRAGLKELLKKSVDILA